MKTIGKMINEGLLSLDDKLIGALPRTTDGVLFTFGKVYVPGWYGAKPHIFECQAMARHVGEEPYIGYVWAEKIAQCYSTREAAQAVIDTWPRKEDADPNIITLDGCKEQVIYRGSINYGVIGDAGVIGGKPVLTLTDMQTGERWDGLDPSHPRNKKTPPSVPPVPKPAPSNVLIHEAHQRVERKDGTTE